jgi:PLP dependent protein
MYADFLESLKKNPAYSSQSKVLAVSKRQTLEKILKAYDEGCRDFGESKVQEALEKIPQLPQDIHWHFIGRLQKNKINKVLGNFSLIHSVDDLELAKEIAKRAFDKGITQKILIQVNVSGEEAKAGLSVSKWEQSFPELLSLEGIEVSGLMTMAPYGVSEEALRLCFSKLREFRDKINELYPDHPIYELSMGMSGDYPIALEEGATIIRIGTNIFGERL